MSAVFDTLVEAESKNPEFVEAFEEQKDRMARLNDGGFWESTRFHKAVLGALQGKHVYQGTVDPGVKASRRAKNKAARAARRLNRR